MSSLAPRVTGVIEMEPTPSRVESFLFEKDERDCAGDLARLARGGERRVGDRDADADEVLFADVDRLTDELEAEYAAVCALIHQTRR